MSPQTLEKKIFEKVSFIFILEIIIGGKRRDFEGSAIKYVNHFLGISARGKAVMRIGFQWVFFPHYAEFGENVLFEGFVLTVGHLPF